jgi:energy-coupling factor transporter ATP-binding protein EcfA2
VPDRLLIPETLYGREREIDALLAGFDRVVAQGTPELVLVAGYSGIGKSSVVNELHKVLVPPRGLLRPASSTSTSATSRTPPWPRPSRALCARSWAGARRSSAGGGTP